MCIDSEQGCPPQGAAASSAGNLLRSPSQSIEEQSTATGENTAALHSPDERTLVLPFVTHIDALLLLLGLLLRRGRLGLLFHGRRRLRLLFHGRRGLGLLFHGLGWRRCWFGVAVTAVVMAGAGHRWRQKSGGTANRNTRSLQVSDDLLRRRFAVGEKKNPLSATARLALFSLSVLPSFSRGQHGERRNC